MREEKIYYVYILASAKNGTTYTGVTNNVEFRTRQHKSGKGSKFTKKYGVDKLVYFEQFGDIGDAIHREKCIKKWNRAWKLRLIEKDNPSWSDLYDKLFGEDYCG